MTTSDTPRDCRLEEATGLLNSALCARGFDPLTPASVDELRSRTGYPRLLAAVERICRIDVQSVRVLLDAWHSWNTERSLP